MEEHPSSALSHRVTTLGCPAVCLTAAGLFILFLLQCILVLCSGDFISVLNASETPEVYIQPGHSSPIQSLSLSKDGNYIVSGGGRTAILWDMESGKEILNLEAHEMPIWSVDFSPDGRYVLTASSDRTIKLWNISTGRKVITLAGHLRDVTKALFSPDGKLILSTSKDNTVRLWNAFENKLIWTASNYSGPIKHISFSHDGIIVFAVTFNGIMKVIDAKTGKELHTYKTSSGYTAALSPESKAMFIGDFDGKITVYDVTTGKELKSFGRLGVAITASALNGDNSLFAALDEKGVMRIWDTQKQYELFHLDGLKSARTVIFSIDNKYVITAGDDNIIRFFDVFKRKEVKSLKGYMLSSQKIILSSAKTLVSGMANGVINIWDIEQGAIKKQLVGHARAINTIDVSKDGRYIISGGVDTKIILWDTTQESPLKSTINNIAPVERIILSDDAKTAISADAHGVLKLWDISTRKVIKSTEIFSGREVDKRFTNIDDTSLSTDKRYLWISNGNHSHAVLFDLQKWTKVSSVRLPNESGIFPAANFSDKFIVRSEDNKLFFYDKKTLEKKHLIGEHKQPHSVVISSNNEFVVSSGIDSDIKIWWLLENNNLILKGHSSSVSEVILSANSQQIVSRSSYDGTVRLWDIKKGQQIASFINFTDNEWIVITPEGYYNSSLNGHKYLNIRMRNKVYGIDQFYDVFYRPDIVTAKLRGEDIKPLITLTIDDAIKNPPPDVDFTSVPFDSSTPQVKVCYQAKNTGGGIGEVRLFHNGKLIQSDGFYKDVAKTAGKIQLASLDSKSIREDMRSIVIKSTIDSSPIASKAKGDIVKDCVVVDAVPGDNDVSVSAFNKDNTVQSYMKTSSFKANIKAEDSHLYMLIVGTDQYNDQSVNLKYAVKDARDIKDKLLSQSETLYKPENIHAVILTDKEATKENIQSQISVLAKKIKPADRFVLFVAGHGVLLQNQYFMLTQDFDGAISDNSMISSNEIVEASKQIKSLSQLFIFDTCHAGGVDYIVSGLYDARMSVLAKKMGLHIYASANDKQAAMDGYKGNGLFTYTLLSGLNNGKEADKNNDGAVSLVELGGYSKQATADISKEIGHSQTPLIINFGKDQPVYKLQNVR